MNDGEVIASYLLPTLSEITNPEHTSQFKLLKDPQSVRAADVLINKILPVALNGDLLTFRDNYKKFKLEGDPLKMMT